MQGSLRCLRLGVSRGRAKLLACRGRPGNRRKLIRFRGLREVQLGRVTRDRQNNHKITKKAADRKEAPENPVWFCFVRVEGGEVELKSGAARFEP